MVYAWCMSRTNIDLDDDLVAAAMRKYGATTKREAVNRALKEAVGEPLTKEFILSLEGIGWDGDLDALRDQPPPEW